MQQTMITKDVASLQKVQFLKQQKENVELFQNQDKTES